MASEEPGPAAENDAHVLFTSEAWEPGSAPDAEAQAAVWLETQAAHPFIQEVARRSFGSMALSPGAEVLDVGCGVGVMLPAMAQAVGSGGNVTGLDHSGAFLRRAQWRLQDAGLADRVRLVEGDACALPFEDGTFDVVHAERVLMHLDEPDRAIHEMTRVARQGGRVVCAELFPLGVAIDHPDPEIMQLLTRATVSQLRHPSIGIELRRRCIQAGLLDVTVEVVVDVETVLDREEIPEFGEQGRAMAVRGEVDLARVEAALAHMIRADDRGVHTGIAMMFVAAGRVG